VSSVDFAPSGIIYVKFADPMYEFHPYEYSANDTGTGVLTLVGTVIKTINNGSPVYQLKTAAFVGPSVIAGCEWAFHCKLTVDGAIDPTDITYSGQLISTLGPGTSPMVIASTDLVTNLNATYWTVSTREVLSVS